MAAERSARPAPQAARARRKRGSLSSEEILRSARQFIEQHGIGELSMPALAKQLKAGVTSIYWYFPSKDDLLSALADQVTHEIGEQLRTIGSGPWDKELTDYFVAFRDIMSATPMFREIMVYHPSKFVHFAMGPEMVRRIEAGLDRLVQAGLSPLDAVYAFGACTNYTRGFIMTEHGLQAEPQDVADASGSAATPAGLERYASLAPLEKIEAIYGLEDDAFRTGLGLLIAGIGERVQRSRRQNKHTTAATPRSRQTRRRRRTTAPDVITIAAAKPARRPRNSLSRTEILDAAERLIEARGLQALSVPILAKHLQAGVTSIYWYFRSKEELLVALAERVTARLYGEMPPIGDGPWDEELFRYFVAYRDELHRSPVYLELASLRPKYVFTRPRIFPLVVQRIDGEIDLAVRGGLTAGDAARLYQACSTYTRSYAQLEHSFGADWSAIDEGLDVEIGRIVADLDADAFPVLTKFSSRPGALLAGDQQFREGLRLMIAGAGSTMVPSKPKRATTGSVRKPTKRPKGVAPAR